MQLEVNPSNPTINTPLIGVVVDTPNKTLSAAAKIFDNYSIIAERIKNLRHESFKNHVALAASVIVCVILVMAGSFMINTYSHGAVAGILCSGFSIFCITTGIVAWRDIPVLEQIEKDMNTIIIADKISAFSNACKQFEKNPSEKGIPYLFKHLEELILVFSEREIKIFKNEDDYLLFSAVSKFFLMNEIMNLLDIPELEEDLFRQKYKIEKPDINAYNRFLEVQKSMESFKIRKKMVDLFKLTLNESL